jgi:hypothetical protein
MMEKLEKIEKGHVFAEILQFAKIDISMTNYMTVHTVYNIATIIF